MKSIKLYGILFIILNVLSCSSDNNGDNNQNNLANYTPRINCTSNTVIGPIAAYWDYGNSVPPPLAQVPILANPGTQFIHSQHPYLGLTIPQGYTALEDTDQFTAPLGVNIIRNGNNAALWRYVPLSTYPLNFTVDDIIAREINDKMFAFYGANGNNFEVLCENKPPLISENGITRVFSSRLIRFGNFTGLVWVNVTAVQGLPTLSVASSVSAGPTNEFDNLVMDVFLPLSFQLLVSDRTTLSDRDNDGTPDIFDREPDNPDVQ
ncbi:hypothetical protein [Hwangdonia lutea]|uniref:Lipoprotein n=1 Tax=Hwangdonia lutea TaxID=3075823 RepID=A0AA97EPL4_9FLAO|nr:hypothetical protein [Hwangdonia sp. SCSIO 19198]WOD44149.1 hypothetical protein RNZ46_02540 [Hwangdonia sp. SCSIO 19198]